MALQVAAKKNPEKLVSIPEEKLQKAVVGFIAGDRVSEYLIVLIELICIVSMFFQVPICSAGLRTAAFLLQHQISHRDSTVTTSLVTAVARSINHNSTDIKTLAAVVCSWLGRVCPNIDLAALKVKF